MDKEKLVKSVENAQKKAEVEIKKLEKSLADAGNKAKVFIKKNPEKAAVIATGIGAAIGAALAFVLRGGKKK